MQRRATKIPTSMKSLPYEERLKICGLTTLEERRTRGDLIHMLKALRGIENIEWFTGPRMALATQTRWASENDYRLVREFFPSKARNDFAYYVSLRHEFFVNRVTKRWNRLSNHQITSSSINSFKARIDAPSVTAAIA